jgi:hypothetical protein
MVRKFRAFCVYVPSASDAAHGCLKEEANQMIAGRCAKLSHPLLGVRIE